MDLPVRYDHGTSLVFGGNETQTPFDEAWAVVLPVPYEETTSYVTGTRNGPREILAASSQVELWDEETSTEVLVAGVHTLPEMNLPAGDLGGAAIAEIRRVVGELARHDKFLVFLGGEHSITAPIVDALAQRTAGLSVLQIDAHADLRDQYLGSSYSHACAMRRVLERVPCTQVAIRSLSREEAEALPSLRARIFYDVNMRRDPAWMERVVAGLTDRVYLTIDCDGSTPPSCRPSAPPSRAACRGTRCSACSGDCSRHGRWWAATSSSCAQSPGWWPRTSPVLGSSPRS
jgi:agmatinase